ncbi:hypothetical protein ACYOEI_15700, partial [Singulisphaera rosea]
AIVAVVVLSLPVADRQAPLANTQAKSNKDILAMAHKLREQRDSARANLYVAEMRAAANLRDEGNAPKMNEILGRFAIPEKDTVDLRSFE